MFRLAIVWEIANQKIGTEGRVNDMRLIDCEPLIEFCEEVVSVDWNHKVAPVSWAYAEQEFMDRLKEAPTIDAVPVVRCRECIHRTENGNCGHPRHEDTLPTAYSNDFCSYGERRGGDGDA